MVNSIPSGSPHVLRAHMWALSTCGAWPPNEIKRDTHPKNITALFAGLDKGPQLLRQHAATA